eukprot:CAMPEP_0117540544 /NCGR_PEP_ID=MMETSP0784-20121206/43555_1 /TAXON_ID=39447 /ORGANISM="" /LENGTH=622 /DNA_ID=CAMNT_0005337205 /DNA_START=151 /DNA_END=2016 /DNA_ORIENTATION=+
MEKVGIVVPSDNIARVIGKAGAGLRAIREGSGCKVQVIGDPRGEAGKGSRVDLSGWPEQIATAVGILVGKACLGEAIDSLTVMIPAERAGAAVGKGGENLRRIREECRVRVTLEREPSMDPSSNLPERAVIMHGDAMQLPQALRYVLGVGPLGAFSMANAQMRAPGLPLGNLFAAPGLPGYRPFMSYQPMLSNVRLPSSSPEEIQVHMVVPDRFAGSILGKGGEKVKQISSTSNAKVSLTTREGTESRRVVVMGTYPEAAHAQSLIYDALVEAAKASSQDVAEVCVIFFIRREAAGVVIGKQGATMKGVREKALARIHLVREEVEGQRPCFITGSLEAVLQTEKLLAELVSQVPVQPVQLASGVMGAIPVGGVMALPGYAPAMMGQDFVSAFAMGKRGPRTDDLEACTKLLVPAQSAGAVIGRQGSGLKQLREACGVQVEMLQPAQAPQWPTDRVVILKGTLTCRQAAADAVLRTSTQAPMAYSCSVKMLVPSTQAGSVIGKQGHMLRTIREHCGASAQVERADVAGERLVTATGSISEVLAAVAAIILILAHARHASGTDSLPVVAAPGIDAAASPPGPVPSVSKKPPPQQGVATYAAPPGPSMPQEQANYYEQSGSMHMW